MLQTEDYARAIAALRHLHVSHDEIERRVALRMARQAFLSQPGAPDLWVALDEAALRRPLGDQKLQQAQLLHLTEMAQRPNITLQIVPLDAGAHAAAGGPFTILRFAEPDLPDIVYLEHLTNALYLDKKRDTVDYLAIMDNLCIQAESPTSTINFLHSIINESHPKPTDHKAAVVATLTELHVRPDDRVLIMLPDGPGFAEAFAAAVQQGAVPLPASPLLSANDIVAVAAEADARLVLVSAGRIPALAGMGAEPPVLIDGPHGRWAAALRLRSATAAR
ncbi:MAG: Scr1 family TA system antitoxin-like transcriptional regulator [Pseudonocardiaceae bacterium]